MARVLSLVVIAAAAASAADPVARPGQEIRVEKDIAYLGPDRAEG